MQTLLMVPTGIGVGLTSACLGMIHALDCLGIRAGFLKPFGQTDNLGRSIDQSSSLVDHTFNLHSPTTIDQHQVERMIGDNQLDELLEQVVSLHREAAQGRELIIVEGVVPTGETSYASQLNAALAQALDASVILVTTADIAHADQLADKLDMHLRPFGGAGSIRALGALLMRVQGLPEESAQIPLAADPSLRLTHEIATLSTQLQQHSRLLGTDTFPLIGMVPFSNQLSVPRTADIAEVLGATWINQGEAYQRRVLHTTLTARSVSNALTSFQPGTLIVTPGDRDDIIVAAALATMNGMPLAGVLLTGGFMPSQHIADLCRPALKTGLPVLSVTGDSFDTVSRLSHMNNEIPADDLERAEQVTRFVSSHIDIDWLKTHCAINHSTRLSPSAFRYELVQKAQARKKRIVLPEGAEPRTVQAAAICQARGIAQCVLLAKPEEVLAVAQARAISLPADLEILDPEPIRQRYVAPMVALRKGKLTEPMAEAQLQDTVVMGTMMLALGEVDGLVSGAVHTTANTVRPAFQLIKTAPDYSLVSSIFFMLLPDEVVVYGDCAINPDPNAAELAEIAIQSAESAIAFGIEPRVAMISYSTGESGTGTDVDKVREATKIAQARRPDLLIDGPLQYDAAAIESVGKQKAPDSQVAGRANVFVFPDLNTGNTTYKAVQRSANVVSVGPMLQGLNKPVNDLSRGALVDDIVFTIALTAIQAIQREHA